MSFDGDWLVPLSMLLAPVLLEYAGDPGGVATAAEHRARPERRTALASQHGGPHIVAQRVRSPDDLPLELPDPGDYRVHLIDVGTGLAVLVQGHDFNLLYDGGSADDKSGITGSGNKSRLVAYLYAAIGPSGPAQCRPQGDDWPDGDGDGEYTIDHVFLSHPHEDHGSLLDDVLACYDVDHVWDSGVVNDTVFYRRFLQAVADEEGVAFHTAAQPPPDRTYAVKNVDVVFPAAVPWSVFSDDQNHVVWLDDDARLTILHASGEHHHDPNQNSIVIRVDLGDTSLLLTGDAESGGREHPNEPVGDVEEYLLDHHESEIDVDILQVGHHGSETSSRRAFLEAVSPSWALIGAGPKVYSGHKLPDPSVTAVLRDVLDGASALPAANRILRTDVNDFDDDNDVGCPLEDRIGVDNDRPGGCDSYMLSITGD